VGVYRDCPNFLSTPIISGTDKATNFKFGRYIHRVHPNKSPLKFWEKMERGCTRDFPNFCSTPIISGTGKATNFNFCTHILSIDRNKSLLQISGKVAGCIVRTLKTFQGTHILGASRSLLCDSSAVLYLLTYLCSLAQYSTVLAVHCPKAFARWQHRTASRRLPGGISHCSSF